MKRHRGIVISNIDTTIPGVLALPDNPNDLVDLALRQERIKEGCILLVIDEAQMIFNCREWNAKDRKDWLFFLTHHRKYGYKILLVTQSLTFLDKQIRQLVEYEYRYRRLSRWGWVGFVLFFLTFGEKYLYVQYYVPNNERMGLHISLLGRNLYKCYNTFAIPNRERQAASDGLGVRASEGLDRQNPPVAQLSDMPKLVLSYFTNLFNKLKKRLMKYPSSRIRPSLENLPDPQEPYVPRGDFVMPPATNRSPSVNAVLAKFGLRSI
jgi:hypothetical protein